MKVGPYDVRTLDDCPDIMEIAFKSEMRRQQPPEQKTRVISRLPHILEITERQELGK